VSSGPIALIEVGASAGLNLFPDRYSYSWGGDPIGTGPLLTAAVAGAPPLPVDAGVTSVGVAPPPHPTVHNRETEASNRGTDLRIFLSGQAIFRWRSR
jgi:hypothetical protein